MKQLLTTSLIFVFLSLASHAYALPDCPEDQSQTYHNCFGTGTYADGSKYVGEYKDGKMHGQGTETWANGSKYVGEFKDNMRHGEGTYTSADGDVYAGEWKDGKKHGKGTYTSADGTKQVGKWQNGKKQYSANDARIDCAKEAGKAGTTYAAKRIEETCLEQKGYGKAWYEF